MRTRTKITQRIYALVGKGYTNKAIIKQLKCKPQTVYNVRYRINRELGLGAIDESKKYTAPVDGIGVPPRKKRKYVRRNVGTGISTPIPISEHGYTYRWLRTHKAGWEPVNVKDHPELMLGGSAAINTVTGNVDIDGLILCRMPIAPVQAPTLWQRIKWLFHG